MDVIYSDKQGRELLEFARKVLEGYFKGEKIAVPDKLHFRQARGVYIFLRKDGKIAGSHGFSKAAFALGDAISRSVLSAAFDDKKTSFLKESELKEVKIEINVLNEPIKVKGSVFEELDYGNEGLFCRYITYSGFLLPEAIKERNLNKVQFIEEVCNQAGLPRDYWQKGGVEFWRFRVQNFKEDERR